jgi:integrase
VHRYAQIVSKALRAAVEDGRLGRNPAEGLSLPRIEREEMRFLGPDEIAALAEVIDPAYRALVLVGAYGGLRLGEMLALRPARVDVLRGRVEVLSTLVEVGGHLIENPPKTRAGRRAVPLPRVAAEAVREHLEHFPADPDDFLFRGPGGGPVWPRAWRRRAWQPACVRAGLGTFTRDAQHRDRYTGLRAHDLRHSAVALWIAAGASPNRDRS